MYFSYVFGKNLLSHFSWNFLFSSGGTNYQFNVPGYGTLFKVNIIFLLLGALFLLKKRDKAAFLIIGWWVLATIPSSMTREAPHALRSITILPVPMLVSAIGFLYSVQAVSKLRYGIALRNFLLLITGLLTIQNFVNYYQNYFQNYRKNYSWSWQYGYKQAADYINTNYAKYDRIIITKKYGEPHEFILFYGKINPVSYFENGNLIRFKQSDWFWVDRYDKYYFVNDWDIPKEEWQPFVLESKKEELDCRKIRCLLITSPGNVPKTWNKLETVNFLDGNKAFEIYEN
jgi:hypothetical protein